MGENRYPWLASALMLVAFGGCGAEETIGRGERLTRIDPATAGQCPSGGMVEHSGIDDDEDGALDDSEIDDSEVLCTDPHEVSRRVPVPAGERCATGGTEVQVGPDRNGNGQLDDDEVERRQLECNPDRLTRVIAEPEGPHCLAGGSALQAGPDLDRDGVLDDNEVEETQYQCSTVLERDAVIGSAAEAAAFAEITEVRGSLVITNRDGDLPTATLPQLRKVTGELDIAPSVGLASVSLPELTDAGSLAIGTSYGSNTLGSVSLPKLARITSHLTIAGNTSLSTLDLPALRAAAGHLVLERNTQLRSFSLALTEPMLDVTASQNPQLDNLSLSVPEAPTVTITSNPKLTKLTIADPGSETRAGKLGEIYLNSNPLLAHSTFTAERIGSFASYDSTTAISTRLVADQIEGTLRIDASGTLSLERRNAAAVPIVIDGELRLRGSLVALNIPSHKLRVEGHLTIQGTGITELRNIDHIGGAIRLYGMTRLATIGPISFVGGMINIVGADELTSLSCFNQPEIYGPIAISGNAKLEKMPFLENVRTIHGSLGFSGNPKLKEVISPVSSVKDLIVEANDALERLQLDNITHLDFLDFRGSSGMPTLSLPSLQTLYGLSLWHNRDLQQLLFPNLQSLREVSAEANDLLSNCSLQEMCTRFAVPAAKCYLRRNGPCQ